MSALRFTTNELVAWGANTILNNQQLTDERKGQIRRVTEFNLLVTTFNVATILVITAVAATALCAYSAAIALGSIGLFVRFATERELIKYTLPPPELPVAEGMLQGPVGAVGALLNRMITAFNPNLLRHALHQATPDEKTANIFLNLHISREGGWIPDWILFDETSVFKNKVDIPAAGT